MKQLYCIAGALVSRDHRYTVIDFENNGHRADEQFSLPCLSSQQRVDHDSPRYADSGIDL
jgi:hypothetical protein